MNVKNNFKLNILIKNILQKKIFQINKKKIMKILENQKLIKKCLSRI